MDKDKDMSRRRFLKMAALTGAAMCVGPTLNKVTAAERVWMGKQQVANNIPAGMAAVRTRRTLGHGNTAFTVSAMGYGCMGFPLISLYFPQPVPEQGKRNRPGA